MTRTVSLGFNPMWYIADFTGRPLAGGFLATRRQLDPQQIKLVFKDIAGIEPWPYLFIPNNGTLTGIQFNANGSQGPFYFEFDSATAAETYRLEVYDSNGNLQWTIEDYTPGGGGGGSIITEVNNLTNQLTNNIMWRNIGASASPVGTTFLKLALGAHAGLAQTSSNAGPDICFIKNTTAASDQLQFLNFALQGNLFTPDTMPPFYLNYTSNGVLGETFKYVQFPITSNVQNLSDTEVTVSIWAQCTGGNTDITLQWLQFFGDGPSASTSVTTPIATQTLTGSWEKYEFTVTVPNVISVTNPAPQRGECGNDGLFLQIQYPLGAATVINFTKPSVYIGAFVPESDFEPFDYIDAKINAPRTGYIFDSYDLVAPFGYVYMNDGTIGNTGSGATSRANIDTFPLYNLLYVNVTIPSANTLCNVTGFTGDPIADFSANRTMSIPRALGRVFSGAGLGATLTNHALGFFNGEETHTLTIAEMPAHNHPGSTFNTTLINSGGGGQPTLGSDITTTKPVSVASQGGGLAHNTIQPTSYLNHFIKL
ncbi:MAG: hypothetical protein Q8936_14280 [Bacillota bacterium]|nr:hypothetical protein [Bacillota bacterium]